jgi:hypothetical protein
MIFNFTAIAPAAHYRPRVGCVLPRPIAPVTTRDPGGRCNAARGRARLREEITSNSEEFDALARKDGPPPSGR